MVIGFFAGFCSCRARLFVRQVCQWNVSLFLQLPPEFERLLKARSRGVPVVFYMHTCLRREAWLGMDMLPGLLTPARQGGRERERADPQVRASVHRFHRKGDE
eukprot:1057062-Pleurochrysis_carterae.AAC.1